MEILAGTGWIAERTFDKHRDTVIENLYTLFLIALSAKKILVHARIHATCLTWPGKYHAGKMKTPTSAPRVLIKSASSLFAPLNQSVFIRSESLLASGAVSSARDFRRKIFSPFPFSSLLLFFFSFFLFRSNVETSEIFSTKNITRRE